MTDLLPHLKQLISTSGLSAHEGPIRGLIEEAWKPLADEIKVSRLGSLHALQRGTAPEPRPSILLAGHMDAIGMMVTSIVDGFLHFTEIGGIDPRVLPGQPVTVHGREDLLGVVVQPNNRLLPSNLHDRAVPMKFLLVDTGLPADEVAQKVRPGDLISFAQEPIEIGEDCLAGHSIDDRAAVATLTLVLEYLRSRPHAWDVWAAATVQEEETLGGALTSAFQIHPTLAVAIDVTFARSPGCPSHVTFPLGEGPTIVMGPNIHPFLHKTLKEVAERLEIPYHVEPTPRHSGTDAMALQVAAEGIPTAVIGIPLRYMHTPVELVALKDIRRAARLLGEFISGLELDFAERISWED